MPLSKQQIYEELTYQRQTSSLDWVDPDFLVCNSYVNLDGQEEPGFNVLFARLDGGNPEFDHLSMWFRMTYPPPEALAWCQEMAPLTKFTSFFVHDQALHIRHGMMISAQTIDRETFVNNYWVFSATLKELFSSLDELSQRKR